jgi:hypothetical protein
LGFVVGADQRKDSSGGYGDVGAADDFEEAEGAGDFLVAPLVAGDYCDAEDFDLWRLEEDEKGLHVAAAGAGAVLVDDDFAAGLCGGEARDEEEGEECAREVHLVRDLETEAASRWWRFMSSHPAAKKAARAADSFHG